MKKSRHWMLFKIISYDFFLEQAQEHQRLLSEQTREQGAWKVESGERKSCLSTTWATWTRGAWQKTCCTLLPAVHFLEQAFAGADFSTEKFSAALSLISAALFQCPKIAKFSVAHFFKLSCDLRCSFSIAKSRKILRCSSSDIWKGSKLSCREY